MNTTNKSQALAVMAEAFKASNFTAEAFTVGITGTLGEGGTIWTTAQALYPGSVWDAAFSQVTFEDGSAVEYIRHPDSMFSTTYKAVGPLPLDAFQAPQVAQETRSDLELAQYLLEQVKDYWTAQDGRLLVNFQEKGVWRMLPGVETLEWEKRETLVLMPVAGLLVQYATIEQAYQWLQCSLTNSYCLECLGISPNHPDAAKLIESLEARFRELLKLGNE